jgi:multidrug efflux system outer membrane protein
LWPREFSSLDSFCKKTQTIAVPPQHLDQVTNALVSYSHEQERRDRLNEAVSHSQLAVDLATEQYKAGLVDFLSVLDAQRDLYANEDQLVQSQTTVTTNLVGLYRSLGGGWSASAVVSMNRATP